MTKKQKNYKKALLKLVHISKMYKEVYANDRELWEEFLNNNYGVKSSKFLSVPSHAIITLHKTTKN